MSGLVHHLVSLVSQEAASDIIRLHSYRGFTNGITRERANRPVNSDPAVSRRTLLVIMKHREDAHSALLRRAQSYPALH